MEPTVPFAIAVAAAFLLALGAVADDRRARVRRRFAAQPTVEPPLIHSINDDRCIGCEACVDACPTEVLELVDHKARVIRFSDCVQCEQCANACPTTAMVMYREGHTPQTLTVPELDDHFQTGVAGQYLIGEVAGKPLVKNAANLGRAVVEHITRDLATRPAVGGDVLDVAIVGSGPGGLSAGLTCLHNRLSCVVLEKEHVLASTVARYPKGKLFMAEPVDSGNVSYLPVFDATKEELVLAWQQVAAGAKLPLKLGEAVDTVVRGDDGVFTIKTTVATYRARAVILATGLRGKPRLLAVPGANLEKVQSRLDDPDEFAGQHVLVVGGGDSAVEAAMSLADVGATVTLSYRGDGFKRCKQGNQQRLVEMQDQISVLLESNIREFLADAVTIKLADGTTSTIPNQQAFVLIGADTPVAWLTNNNVRFVEREHLYALGSTEETVRRLVPDAVECSKDPAAALDVVLGKAPRTSHRLKSMVDHLQHEFRDVVTSVSKVFRLSDLEPDDDSKTRTGVKALPKRGRVKTPPLIPATNLTKPRPQPAPPKAYPVVRRAANPFEPEHTVRVTAYGRPSRPEQATAPRDTTLEAPSLATLARPTSLDASDARSRANDNPFDRDATTLARQAAGNPFDTAGTLAHDTNVETPAVPAGDTTLETPALRRPAPEPRRAAPPPVPRSALSSHRAATEFPPEQTSYGVVYQTSEVGRVPPRSTEYHLRPARLAGGTPPPPVPSRRR